MENAVLHTDHGVISAKSEGVGSAIFPSPDLERSLCWKNKICFELQNFIFAEN